MARIPLLGGTYVAKSLIANAQRCINLFPEPNQRDAPVQLTHYQRPGMRRLAQGPDALPVRGLYQASTGVGYACIGQKVFAVEADWSLTQVGVLDTLSDTPVSMIDNGTTLMLVDSSDMGYEITLGTNVFAPIVDPTGFFAGANLVAFLDTFCLWNFPGTNRFGSTLSNEIAFDATFFGSKTSYPDPIVALAVCQREIFLLGRFKSEIWFDAGNALFAFAELPGASIEHGCAATFSVATTDISVIWLGRDLQGQGVVFRTRGYRTERISTHAIEVAIQQYADISDARAYTYQQNGHYFYVLAFPSGNATWVWDESSSLWHQRCWTDGNGGLNRDRSNCCAVINGQVVVGDWQNGTLYALDTNYYYDDVPVNGEASAPFSCIRTFPHVTVASDQDQGRDVHGDGNRMEALWLKLDIDCGNIPNDSPSNAVGIRVSLDRGHTYGQTVTQTLGSLGQFLTQPKWAPLGVGRDIVIEISYAVGGQATLNGAWAEFRELDT